MNLKLRRRFVIVREWGELGKVELKKKTIEGKK